MTEETEGWPGLVRRIARTMGEELERADRTVGVGVPVTHEIDPYRGYVGRRAGGVRALVQGRARRAASIPRAGAADPAWRNLLSSWRRIDADPLPHARVRISVAGEVREVVADDEGFIREWIELPATPPTTDPWFPATLELLAPLPAGQPHARATAELRVPATSASFGVISDLDDTVLQSRIGSVVQAARTMLLGNARTRLPFPGVAAFYQALERGGDGTRRNPIFYVSSSPWNLHDLIADFMDLQHIPRGPIHLRDWDVVLSALSSSRLGTFKEPVIAEILEHFPALPFILIGDSSQRDPEIYRAILGRYPGRILAIYIRNVHADDARSASIRALASEVLAAGSALVLADDTYAAARHAAEHGWIAPEALPSVREEKPADEGTTGTKTESAGATDEPPAPTIVVE